MGGDWVRWTSDQREYMRRWYGRLLKDKLIAGLAKRGPRKGHEAIKSQAKRMNLVHRNAVSDEYVNLIDVHPEWLNGIKVLHRRCRDRAVREGVAVRQRPDEASAFMVPEWWAEEYLEWYRADQDKQAQARREGWLSSREVATELGFGPERGSEYLTGRRGPRWWKEGVQAAPKVKMGTCGLMWYVSRTHVQPLIARWKKEGYGPLNEGHK